MYPHDSRQLCSFKGSVVYKYGWKYTYTYQIAHTTLHRLIVADTSIHGGSMSFSFNTVVYNVLQKFKSLYFVLQFMRSIWKFLLCK